MKTRIVKLGGSIITRQDSPDLFDRPNVLRLARELAQENQQLIILHGTGLYCKPHAHEHEYVKTGLIGQDKSLIGLRKRHDLRALNLLVVETLLTASLPAYPIDASTFFRDTLDGFAHDECKQALCAMLAKGYVPVFFGDLMPQPDGSFRVFSSDVMTLLLAEMIRPDDVFFLSDTPGVYGVPGPSSGGYGEILSQVSPQTVSNAMALSEEDRQDVSGGMAEKVGLAFDIAKYCGRCVIASGYDGEVLTHLMADDNTIGTRVFP